MTFWTPERDSWLTHNWIAGEKREYIAAVLREHGWRMSDAARTLGIQRANLYRKTRQLGISRLKPSRVS